MNKKLTYIFGHKNPDTDTVCSAIALSYLKNQLGYNTVPMVLGNINAETKYALNKFNIKEPSHLSDVKLQIKDINYHKNCFIDRNLSIKDAFDYMNKYSLTGIPVVESKNKYYGYVSLKEIARELLNGNYNELETSYGNILKILGGTKILKFDKEISGTIVAATYSKDTFIHDVHLDSNNILIVGDRNEIIEYAINSGVRLIILVSKKILNKELMKKAEDNHINVISTIYTAYEVSKLMSYSNYIKNIVREEDIATFHELDYLSDFIEQSKKLKHTNYPILNSKGICTGLLTLTDCNHVDKKKVILVDHNNYSQSVDGLDEADILEVIDHHNIGDIVTQRPINFRNAGVGSVNTIIFDMFNENNIRIPKNIAGIMACAIMSDTLLLTSPTTTSKDRDALIELSKIAKIEYTKDGIILLKQGMSIKGLTNEELLYKDFKSYKVDNDIIGIGQVLTSDYDSIHIDEMVGYLNLVAERSNYKVLTLFFTDIFNHTSHCLYNESAERILKNSFELEKVYEGFELKNVLSRKIQIAPYIMDAVDKDN